MRVEVESKDCFGARRNQLAAASAPGTQRIARFSEEALPFQLSDFRVSAFSLVVEKNRLEAFSDGVFAVIITIMVLEMKVPHGSNLQALEPIMPIFLTYVLSFVYVGIYWNNHHHLMKAAPCINGAIMWANLHLLFWLSLFPFVTGWMGENHLSPIPSALYGVVTLLAAIAFLILQSLIVRETGPGSKLSAALGSDWKGKLSPVLYASGVIVSFVQPWIAVCMYAAVAVMWLIPDRRLERLVQEKARTG